MIDLRFSQVMRIFRKQHGLTQEDLAKKCKISRVSLNRYENDVTSPKLDVAIKISNELNIDLNKVKA